MSDPESDTPVDNDEGDESDDVGAAGADEPEEDSHVDDHSVVATTVATEEGMDESRVDDERSMGTGRDHEDEDEDGKSFPADDGSEMHSPKSTVTPKGGSASGKKKKRVIPPNARKGRAPAVKGLTIPFRTVKKVRSSQA